MKLFTESITSASKLNVAVPPIQTPFAAGVGSPIPSQALSLVEEAAVLEHARALLRRDLDVAGREQEDLVGDTLHAAVERVGEAAAEVDQPLRQILVGALEVEDDGHAVLEAVGDLLRVVEAARQDEMHLRERRGALDLAQTARLGSWTENTRPRGGRRRLGVGPVVELVAALAGRE